MLKISEVWLRFEFQPPKDLVLELAGKHSSCLECIPLEAMGIWLRIHFSGQRLLHRLQSTIIIPKMSSCICICIFSIN